MKSNVPDKLRTLHGYVISIHLSECIAIGSSLRLANIAGCYVDVEMYEDKINLLTSFGTTTGRDIK